MSEWNYSDKNSVIRNASAAQKNAAEALREIRELKKEFALFASQQQDMMKQQAAILKALAALKDAVNDMHAEIYPQVEETKKPFLKMPKK